MNLIDFFIIYLACGAPFGVYYFLHYASEIRSKFFWLKIVFVFSFWMPFAVFLLRQNKILEIRSRDARKASAAKTERTKKFYTLQKQIEKILLESDLKISIYEFRETVERYIGLTLANQHTTASQALRQEAEIYRVTQAKNVELSSICFSRRNRNRLSFHQTEARKDFLRLIERLSKFGADQMTLADLSFGIAQILDDSEAVAGLANIFAACLQTDERHSVKRLEKDLWKPEETRKPQPAKPVTIQLSSMIAATNSRKKD